jgi:predicted membrane chloride channel (bestrophin family)
VAVELSLIRVAGEFLFNFRTGNLTDVVFCVQFVGVVGGAVSLLLVFRTNAAFGRFCAAADSFAEVLSGGFLFF